MPEKQTAPVRYFIFNHSIIDYVIVLSAIICICLGLFFTLIYEFENENYRKDQPEIGTVLNGFALRRKKTSLSWFEIQQGQKIYQGDRVFTNLNKDMKIMLPQMDGQNTFISIPQRSMVTISQGDGKLEVSLGKGTVSVQSETNQVVEIQNSRGEKKKILIPKSNSVTLDLQQSKIKAKPTNKNSKFYLLQEDGKPRVELNGKQEDFLVMKPWKNEDVYIGGKIALNNSESQQISPSSNSGDSTSQKNSNVQDKESSAIQSRTSSNAFKRNKKRSGERFVRKVNELKFPMLYFFLAMLVVAIILKAFEKK